MKKYDVVALGELLIDFTENGKSNQGNPLFEANPVGAPCNVLAMLTKLGNEGNEFCETFRILKDYYQQYYTAHYKIIYALGLGIGCLIAILLI